MLQNITPHGAASNLNAVTPDDAEILGRIYFDAILRAPILKSVTLVDIAHWGEEVSEFDLNVSVPLSFGAKVVGSLQLYFDSGAALAEIEKIQRQVEQDACPQLGSLLAWTGLDFSRRIQILRSLWELKRKFPGFDWIGIYALTSDARSLEVGAYMGEPTEHIRIPIEKGICGAAVRENETVNVSDVRSDPRFIACSVKTRSELVVPIRNSKGRAIAEIDIDSNLPASFTPEKVAAVQATAEKLSRLFEA